MLDVSDESHGNIVGVGFADLTTERLVSKMDAQSFRINTLTSCCLQRSRIPLTLPTDREASRPDSKHAGASTRPRRGWSSSPTRSSSRTSGFHLRWKTKFVAHPHLTCETEFLPMPFLDGRLARPGRMFPESVRGRAAVRRSRRSMSR